MLMKSPSPLFMSEFLQTYSQTMLQLVSPLTYKSTANAY